MQSVSSGMIRKLDDFKLGGGGGVYRVVSTAGATTSIIFVATKVLFRQTDVCRDKDVFVVTKTFVATKMVYIFASQALRSAVAS